MLVPLLCGAPTWRLETSRNISLAEFNCNESVNFSNTVEHLRTPGHGTPRYYGKFSLSLGKGHTFYLNSTRLIRTRTTDTFLAQSQPR